MSLTITRRLPEHINRELRALESKSNYLLDTTGMSAKAHILRLDGCSFSSFTRTMNKPFDAKFTAAILQTTEDLMTKLGGAVLTAFCQSDEISLVLKGSSPDFPYAGRIQKLSSIMASFASVRFNHNLGLNSLAIFDCRAFSCPSEGDAMLSLFWRQCLDGRRNSINMVARSHFSHKQCMNRGLEDLRSSLNNVLGGDVYDKLPKESMYGVFFKRESVDVEGWNPILKENVLTKRMKIRRRIINMDDIKDDDGRLRLIMDSEWNPLHPKSLL